MLTSGLPSVIGLCAAIAWGAADFSGGIASKRTSVWYVVLISQAVGLLFLIITAWLANEVPKINISILYGGLAGFIGVTGLILLYQGLAIGRMGIVAPLSALLSALVPAGVVLLTQGMPKTAQLIGMVIALPAIWFVSSSDQKQPASKKELAYGFGAGIFFACYFLLIDRASEGAIIWPLITARIVSVLFVVPLVLWINPSLKPSKWSFTIIAAAGILDSIGNIFFALATRLGRLDIAAILGALYPAVTILLAYIILHERLAKLQWLGIGMILFAIILINL
jgi:drug/metabolite transporter (DMT)-like permease